MKAKKITAILIAVTITLLASGCNDNVQTQEEIVVPKQEEEAEDTEGVDVQGDDIQAGDENRQGIAEQVQAPETYVWEGKNENVSVQVNAPVVIPEGEGFKTYRVTARTYTQEDYDRISQALFKGASLWSRDYEQMDKSNGFTKEEIERRIERFEANKEAEGNYEITGKNMTYDAVIEEWEAMKEEAPEEPILIEIPAVVPYNGNAGTYEENVLSGSVTVDGQDYYVTVDNNLRDDWRWINFKVNAERTNASYMYAEENSSIEADKFSAESLRQEAEKLVADMGFTEFTVGGEEYLKSTSWSEELNAMEENDQDGYGVYFTRTLDGIPVTYTFNDGTTIEDGVECSWPYESLKFIFDTEGVADFTWSNPYNVEKLSDETVFLIPFSEIQSTFEEMVLKKYGDLFMQYEADVSFQINEVRLGYMRVMEKGNFMEGTMIPVWDFFGSETISYGDGGEGGTNSAPYTSWLTINAMDGTIIDRDLGY